MASPKRRTTSSSGSSAKSPKKGTSSQPAASSATVPASFAAVFGPGLNEKATKLKRQLNHTLATIQEMDALGEPTVALYRIRHKQRRRQLLRYSEALEEAIRHEMADANNN